jgi:tetratricopeptide (TPR) repeat protein
MAERRRFLVVLAGAAMILAVVLTYSPWAARTLVRDDHVLVAERASFRTVSPLALFTEPFWPEGTLGDARVRYYRPIVLLTLRADVALGGSSTELHFTNVLLHGLACLALALAATRFGARGPASLVSALVWGLAPRLTESVAWVSGRTDVLAGLFVFTALALSPEAPTRAALSLRRGRALALASGVCLFLALASKEVAVAGAVALGVLAWRARTRDDGTARRERLLRAGLGVALPCVVYAALRFVALAGATSLTRDLGTGPRLLTALEAIGRYVEMTFDALRPRTVIGLIGDLDPARVALGAVTLLLAGALVARRLRAGRPISDAVVTAATLGVVALGLVVHIVPLSTAGAVASDRLLYLPLAAVALAAAVGASGLVPRYRKVAGALALALALPFAIATKARAHDYDDEARFWVVAVETAHPSNMAPWNALANVLMVGGRADLACAMFEHARATEEATAQRLLPVHRRTREGLASCLAQLGHYDDSAKVAEDLVADHPTFARGYLARGYAQLRLFAFDEAQASFKRVAELDPQLATYVREPLTATSRARDDAPRYAAPEARAADAFGYATHLQRVGRLPEAEAAHFAIVTDLTANPAARLLSARFLAEYGDLDRARTAAATFRFDPVASAMRAARKRRNDSVVAVLPRIMTLLENARRRAGSAS